MGEQWSRQDYVSRCSDVENAIENAIDKIREWDCQSDPHGYWHERPMLIALVQALRPNERFEVDWRCLKSGQNDETGGDQSVG